MNERDLIKVGQITKTVGIKGELSVMPLTDDPERFRSLADVYVDKPVFRKETIQNVRFHRERVIIKFENCDDSQTAYLYRGSYISIMRDQLAPLKKDSYYIFDLVGCAVYDESGTYIGELADVIETGSNDVYVVKSGSPRMGGFDSGGRVDRGPETSAGSIAAEATAAAPETPVSTAAASEPATTDVTPVSTAAAAPGTQVSAAASADEKEFLIPALKTAVHEVDIARKRIVVDRDYIVG